jgi:hypothetical protein
VRRFALIALVLGACSKDPEHHPGDIVLTEPPKELTTALIEYCRIGSLPREQQKDAQRSWGLHYADTKMVMSPWQQAARDHNPAAIRMIYKAADDAVGPGNCPIVDVFNQWEPRPGGVSPNPYPQYEAGPADDQPADQGSGAPQ